MVILIYLKSIIYNKSSFAVEGLISPCGRILGKMGHSERVYKDLYKNIPDVVEQAIFQAGVDYFKKVN